MIFCDRAIVIHEKDFREKDKIVTLYTQNYGKLSVVFKSVKLARSKMKALSEIPNCGDFRIYHKHEGRMPVCAGGKILNVFPGIRRSMEKLFLSFYFCEVFIFLTPFGQPNSEKYDLLFSALNFLDKNPVNPVMKSAFMLRFMELYGSGFKKTAVGIDARIWDKLHSGDWSEIHSLAKLFDGELIDSLVQDFFKEHLKKPLESEKFF